ncbi:MAG: hypothetical protein MUF22_03985 [Chitinispirillaceae bacterium]|jgi:hypothetical protein|nr:hypothetical protein [Chitinispirillaceae bacterium]
MHHFYHFFRHEYTVSLLFWIIPGMAILGTHLWSRALKGIPARAFLINLAVLAGVGFLLDLLFAHSFFRFPDPEKVIGITIRNIPIEEFLFYIFGFWFILLLYVFNDELFLKRYNIDDRVYFRFARRLKRSVYFSFTKESLVLLAMMIVLIFGVKILLTRGAPFTLPGYALFLTFCTYVPYLFFWKITKYFLNMPALIFTVAITTLISIIWEVTLALPRGYWNYNPEYMVGIFIPVWSNLPVEAVTVWVFSSLIILSFEYTKLILHRNASRVPKATQTSSPDMPER